MCENDLKGDNSPNYKNLNKDNLIAFKCDQNYDIILSQQVPNKL